MSAYFSHKKSFHCVNLFIYLDIKQSIDIWLQLLPTTFTPPSVLGLLAILFCLLTSFGPVFNKDMKSNHRSLSLLLTFLFPVTYRTSLQTVYCKQCIVFSNNTRSRWVEKSSAALTAYFPVNTVAKIKKKKAKAVFHL